MLASLAGWRQCHDGRVDTPLSSDQPRTVQQKWQYLLVPLSDAAGLKKSGDLMPERLNELGAQGWEAVGLSLKKGDLVAWPVVLLKRPAD
jgi:hypothetical protein